MFRPVPVLIAAAIAVGVLTWQSAAPARDAGADAGLAAPLTAGPMRERPARDGGLPASTDAGGPAGEAVHRDAGPEPAVTGTEAGVDDAPPALPEPDDLVITTPAVEKPPAPEQATETVLRTIVGLVFIVFLAYVAARPAVQRLERRLRVTQLITSGFPFVILGLAAHQFQIVVPETILRLTPLLHFGLGWVGFVLGFRFDVRVLDRVPEGTALAVAVSSGIPFVGITLAAGLAMVAFGGSPTDPSLVRDALALGLAGAITAPRIGGTPNAAAGPTAPSDDLLRRIGQLDEITGVAGLAFLASYIRPADVALAWDLTGTAWLFITLGMGVAIGIVLYAALSMRSRAPEFLALSVGSVAFAAGMAGFLHLSPVVVCFIAGALATNLPFKFKYELAELLTRFERPIWLVFLAMAGALWDPRDWRGWVLVPIFVFARFASRGLALLTLRARAARDLPLHREHRLVFSRVSVISIAIVISVETLYRGRTIPWIVTAVLGAAAVSEVLVQLIRRGEAAAVAAEGEP